MKDNQTGDFLRSAFPVADSPLSDLLTEAGSSLDRETSSASLFSPLIVLNLPQSYLNREGRRVDICGTVDTSSVEYSEGYRYYSSNALFFLEDGRCTPKTECSNDLISVIDEYDIPLTTKPLPLSKWVHPIHYVENSFFESLERSREPVKVSGYYLNRMGFVVEIVALHDNVQAQREGKEIHSGDPWLVDSTGQAYHPKGTTTELGVSMYDLVYEIINWDLFNKTDWSEEILYNLTGHPSGSNQPPELFNPVGENRLEKKQRLFDHLLSASALAKDLGITFGFHMNDGMGTPSN